MRQLTPHHEESVSRGPTRTCAGCGRKASPSAMVRLAVGSEPPYLAPDLAGKLPGRGVWVDPSRSCLERAARRGGFSRALRREIRVSTDDLASSLVRAYEARLAGLIASARRARALSLGADASIEALERGEAALVFFTRDAAGRREEIERLAKKMNRGVLVHGDKAGLGTLLGRAEVGVVTINDAGLAHAVTETIVRSAALSEVG